MDHNLVGLSYMYMNYVFKLHCEMFYNTRHILAYISTGLLNIQDADNKWMCPRTCTVVCINTFACVLFV